MTWTDDRIASLRQDWLDGYSASQIAQRLGGVTRNAVIGKVHRLGLAGRTRPSRYMKPPRSRSASRPLRAPVRRQARAFGIRHDPASRTPERRLPLPELGPAPPKPVTLESLTSPSCRWPQGDPKAADFHFCGRIKSRAGIPYCDHHAAIAFR
jgi:GcrA cell cycle regulator